MTVIQSNSYRQYWSANQAKIAQRFYVAQCLLISAASDYAIALQLRDTNKLNWACACSYYSMVHSGRLITFIPLGSFPTSHATLIRLFKDQDGSGINLGWLGKFNPQFRNQVSRMDPPVLPAIAAYYSQVLPEFDVAAELDLLGKTLDQAKKLREDSNYEALLIAHEYNHDIVSSEFNSLSDRILQLAARTLRFSAACFKRFIESDEDLSARRVAFRHFACQYIKVRILDQVGDRCGPEYVGLLSEILSGLLELAVDCSPDIESEYEEIQREISYEIFGGKSQLMREFKTKIANLANLDLTY